MPGEINTVSTAITSIADLVGGVLSRADRDGPTNELNENLIKIQNAFADNSFDSDDFRAFIDILCNGAGQALTPTGDIKLGRRELLHALLVIAANHVYAKQIISRLVANSTK